MQPAAVMGKHPPFAPAAGEFAKSQLLLTARVMPAPVNDLSKCYTVDGATFKDGELTLSYRFNAPQSKAVHHQELPRRVGAETSRQKDRLHGKWQTHRNAGCGRRAMVRSKIAVTRQDEPRTRFACVLCTLLS